MRDGSEFAKMLHWRDTYPNPSIFISYSQPIRGSYWAVMRWRDVGLGRTCLAPYDLA